MTNSNGKLVYDRGLVTLTGYDFVQANLPVAHLVGEAGNDLRALASRPYRKGAYQIELNLQKSRYIDVANPPCPPAKARRLHA